MVHHFRGYSGVASGEVLPPDPGDNARTTSTSPVASPSRTRADELREFILARSAIRTPSTRSVTLQQLHNIFGHMAVESLITAVQKGSIAGFKISDISSRKHFSCDACKRGRGVLLPITKPTRYRAHRFLYRVFVDTIGPQRVHGIHHNVYSTFMVDDATHKVWVKHTKTKAEIGTWITSQLRHLMAFYEVKVVLLHTDNAREYSVNDGELFEEYGIQHTHGVPHVSEFQGVVERCIRTVSESSRICHAQSRLPRRFWEYAIDYAVHMLGYRPSTALPDGWSPNHAVDCGVLSAHDLHPFGCRAYVDILPPPQRCVRV